MPRYVTADALAGVPTIADLSLDEQRQALDDAGDVLGWIQANQWATDGELRKHYEQADWEPDRLNLALGVLRDTGQVLTLEPRHQTLLSPGA